MGPKVYPLLYAALFLFSLHAVAAEVATSAVTGSPSPSATLGGDAYDFDHIPIVADPAIWKMISDEDGVRTYEEKNPDHGVVAFRGETRMPATLEQIVTVLRDEKIRKEWVDALVEQRKIEQVSPLEQVEYNHSKVPWPFQDRDFVYRAKVNVDTKAPRSLSILMTSIESPLQPEVSGLVRGQILHSFYIMREVPGPTPQTDVLIEMALDPKGAVPLWLVNLIQKRWPHHTLSSLRKLSSKPGLVVPKEIEDYFKTP